MDTVRILQPHVNIGDPHVTSDDADRLSILGNVFEPLLRVSEGGAFTPCVAESWSLSEDACSWAFAIKEDKVFHDGKPCRAADVVFSLRRIRDENIAGELGTGGVIKGYLEGADIEHDGALSVRIRTPEPMADLADLLGDIPILSERSVAALPDDFIGTGSFRIRESSEDRVVLSSDEKLLIWNAEPDDDARIEAVRKGEADVASNLPPRLSSGSAGRVHRSTTSVCAAFMFNMIEGEATNRHLRRALNLAIDVDELIQDVMYGAADPLNGPLTRRHAGYDSSVPTWSYDPDAAIAELKAGGIGDGTLITLDIPAVLPDEAPQLAERIAEFLEAVGLRTEVRIESDRTNYALRVREKRIGEAACFDSSPSSTFRVYREKFHSGFAGPWWLGYRNVSFDQLVDEGRKTPDPKNRTALYRQAYSLLREDAPWVFLYNPLRLAAIGNQLEHWDPSSGGLLLF